MRCRWLVLRNLRSFAVYAAQDDGTAIFIDYAASTQNRSSAAVISWMICFISAYGG